MSEDHDPLDGLFASDEPATGGEETKTGTDTQAATGDGTKTAQEAPGADSVNGGQGSDELIVDGKTTMVPKAALDEARRQLREEREARTTKPGDDAGTAEEPAFVQIDPKEDPQGAYEQMMGIVQLNAVNTTLNMSEKMARKEHGAELVDTVMKWASDRFEKEPDFAARILSDPDPYEAAITDYNKAQRDEKIDKIDPAILEGLDEDEIELLKAHRASKTKEEPGSTGQQNTQPRGGDGKFVEAPRRKVDAPPRSIADAPSGGQNTGQQTVAAGEGVAFDDTFR